jgi:hypothetical protein
MRNYPPESSTLHCPDTHCRKCRARARWNRRKVRHDSKNRVRRNTGRK